MQEENEQVYFIIIKCFCIVLNKTWVNVLSKY
jgi:hypothetical protein